MQLRYCLLLALLPILLVRCEPICKEDCGNGICSSPDNCSCDPGYTNYENNPANRCVPVCTGGCGKSQCIAPETCALKLRLKPK